MPIDQLQEETGKVIQFYKIYENVNRKLIECISENSSLNKELNNTILSINQEKRKVDELLNSILKRLKESNQTYEELDKEYSSIITNDMREYMLNSSSRRENLIKWEIFKISNIESFLKDKATNFQSNKNVYNEDEYIILTQQLEEQISRVQKLDKNFEERLIQQINIKGNECERKKE